MKRVPYFRSVGLFFLLSTLPVGATSTPSDPYVPNEILIQMKAGSLAGDRNALESLLGPGQPLQFRPDVLRFNLNGKWTVPQALASLKGNPALVTAQPNFLYHLFQTCTVPTSASDAYFTSGPVPPAPCGGLTGNGNVNWPYLLVNAPAAWAQLTSSLTCPAASPITVAVLDTGIASNYLQTNHPDLPSSLFIPGYNSSGDWGGDTTDTIDNQGHGTMVTGILAAQWNNGGVANACLTGSVPAGNFNGGAVGVAGYPGLVRIMPVKIGPSSGSFTTGMLIEGIYFATLNGAKVLNISGGTPNYDTLTGQAVTFAMDQGCVVVAAVGNNGNGVSPSFPAAFPGVLGVGAVNPSDNVTTYSQTGFGMGIVAPGGNLSSIPSTFDTADNFFGCALNCPSPATDGALQIDPCDNNYAVASGTSLACPMVAGGAALMLAMNPTLINSQVVQILESTAHQIIGAPGSYNQTSGWGRLDLNAALLSAVAMGAQPPPTSTPVPPTPTFTPVPGGCGGGLPGSTLSPQLIYDLQSVSGDVVDIQDGNGPRPFLLGGGAATNPVTIYDWIPSSGWTAFGSSQAPLLNRTHFDTVTFDGHLWVLGGLLNGTTYQNDAWYSFDGYHYILATSNGGFAGRSDFSSLVFQNKLWVLDGQTASGLTNDVWSSPDGSTWTPATAPPFSARKGEAAVVFNNRMWLLGGQTASGPSSEVWSTGDGSNWTQSSPTGTGLVFTPRAYHLVVVCGGAILVMGGNTASGAVTDIWVSQDGANWTKTLAQAPFGPVSEYSSVLLSYNDQVWSVGPYGSYTSNCCVLATFTPTTTPTLTPTNSPTPSPTQTPSPTATQSPTLTPSSTPTLSPTSSPSSTATPSPTVTPTNSATSTPTQTATRTITLTPAMTLTPVPTLAVLYPNPWRGGPLLLTPPHYLGVSDVEVKIFTTAFRKVWSQTFPNHPAGVICTLDPAGPWANGLYYVVVETKQNQTVLKWLVLK